MALHMDSEAPPSRDPARPASPPLISVVVPCYNEEESLGATHARLQSLRERMSPRANVALVYVDDGSSDHTPALLEELCRRDAGITVVSLSRNFGHQRAASAGLAHADGDAVVLIDADLQDPPEVVDEMVAKWLGGVDVVYGRRRRRRGESWFKVATAHVFYRMLSVVANVSIPPDTGDFRLMDRRVVDVLNAMHEHSRFLRGMVPWIGFRQAEILYDRDPRFSGSTKYPMRRMIALAIDAVVGFSSFPLRIAAFFSVLGVLVSATVLVWVLIAYFAGWTVAGWASILAIFSTGLTMVFIVLAIQSEYLGRVFDEVRGRPTYVVRRVTRSGAGEGRGERSTMR